MSRRRWVALLALGVVTAGGMAGFVRVPGYMDAEYYFANSVQLVEGRGLNEPFLWNYLDDPSGLPHASHLYWMPLTSVVAAAGQVLLGFGFREAQLPFILLTAGLPLLTAWTALRVGTTGTQALFAGSLAAFSGFYLPFLVTTDAFVIFAWIGTLAFLTASAAWESSRWGLWFLAGILAGLGGLARADGLLLLAPILGLAAVAPRRRVAAVGLVLSGCAAVIAPWMARNLIVSGSLLAPGGGRTLWLTSYDSLFSFPPSVLSPENWAGSGAASIVLTWVRAAWGNLQSLVVVTGGVLLGPFMVVGARHRSLPIVKMGGAYLGLLWLAMTFAFPFSGPRGGYFHSSAAVLPILWALAAAGLERSLAWLSPRRGWNPERAWKLFAPLVVVGMAGISAWVAWDRVAAGWPGLPRWERSSRSMLAVAASLRELDAEPGVVAVNNPPGLYLATGTPSVVIPDGDESVLRQVVCKFGVTWVVLDANHPHSLAELYAAPDSVDWLVVEAEVEDAEGRPIHLMRVLAPPEGCTP